MHGRRQKAEGRGRRVAPPPRHPVTPSPSRGFTLVEMLVVIVIISLLAAMTTGGIIAARNAARRAIIKTEINQLAMALERYKSECGEYPPDFSGLNDPDPDVQAAAEQVLTRHLRRRFPRYTGDWAVFQSAITGAYGSIQLDPASALAFWLGGLPEQPGQNHLAGFSANPQNPIQLGLPREQPYYDFDPEMLVGYRYYPNLPAGIPQAPFIYFRAQRAPDNTHTYEFIERHPTDSTLYVAAVRSWDGGTVIGRAVPYLQTTTQWESESTYQIISAGLDGSFGIEDTAGAHAAPGSPTTVAASPPPAPPMTYAYPVTQTGANFSSTSKDGDGGDYDNQTNFAEGKLEDELQ